MIRKYYNCNLVSNLIIGDSIATENHINSHDYIPGSCFYGIVANGLYAISSQHTSDILYRDQVLFGDAMLLVNGKQSLPIPLTTYVDKLENNIQTHRVWQILGVDTFEGITRSSNDSPVRPKQVRDGYFVKAGNQLTIADTEMGYTLKSAYDTTLRKSKDAMLYGMEYIKKDQPMTFSIVYKDESLVDMVEEQLLGVKYIGKSKTSEFSHVTIEHSNQTDNTISSHNLVDNSTVVYLASDMSLVNLETGFPTTIPVAHHLGLEGGELDLKKSRIIQGTKELWNAKRNTTSETIHYLRKGSVLVFEGVNYTGPSIGHYGKYQSIGMGTVIFNPAFLSWEDGGEWSKQKAIHQSSSTSTTNGSTAIDSPTVSMLAKRKKAYDYEYQLHERVKSLINEADSGNLFEKIAPSQWSGISNETIQASDPTTLINALLNTENGLLVTGQRVSKWEDKEKKFIKSILEKEEPLLSPLDVLQLFSKLITKRRLYAN